MRKTIGFFCVAAALCLLAAAVPAVAGDDDGKAAHISAMEGTVTVNGQPASPGFKIKNGDTVATGPDSSCEVVFNNKNILRLSDRTSIKMSLNGRKKFLDIVTGAFAALARRLTNPYDPNDFALSTRTPTSICGVRGTAFFVRVENPETTYVCLCNGRMRVSSDNGGTFTDVTANHHKAFRVASAAGAVSIKPADLAYHNDKDMEGLAGRISEKMDWTRVEDHAKPWRQARKNGEFRRGKNRPKPWRGNRKAGNRRQGKKRGAGWKNHKPQNKGNRQSFGGKNVSRPFNGSRGRGAHPKGNKNGGMRRHPQRRGRR